MSITRSVLMFLVLLLFGGSAACAADVVDGSKTGAGNSTDEGVRVQEASALLTVLNYSDTVKQAIESQKRTIALMIDRSLATIPQGAATTAEITENKAHILDAWAKEMSSDSVLQDTAKLYAKLFTLEELRSIMAFYSTAAGQALLKQTVELRRGSEFALTKHSHIAMPLVLKMENDFKTKHNAIATPVLENAEVEVPGSVTVSDKGPVSPKQ